MSLPAEKQDHQPIFCDRCTRLALAIFEDHRLCARCLIRASKPRDNDNDPDDITPLPLTPGEFMEAFG